MNKRQKGNKRQVISKASITKIDIPQTKMKLSIDQLRGKDFTHALGILKNTRRRANSFLIDLLNSALANALQANKDLDVERVKVGAIYSNQGPSLKRLVPRAFGRGALKLKRSCQVYVELEEEKKITKETT